MLPSRLASIALPFFATVALATPAAAAELDLDMQFVAPGAPYTGDQTPIDTPFTMVLSYNFDPHVWTNVTLTLTLPNKVTHPRIAIGATAVPPNTFAPGVVTAGQSDFITWVGTPAANTGISGQIVVNLTAESWNNGSFGASIDGTPYAFTATLTGTSDGAAQPESATVVGTRTGVGQAAVDWQYYAYSYGSSASKPHETTGERGMLFRYNFRYRNCGSNPVVPNSSITVDLGSQLQLARHWAGDNNGAYPGSFIAMPTDGPLTPPGTNGEIWSTTPGTPSQVSVNHPYELGGPPGCAYTNNYYVELWASCESLAARYNATDLTPWTFSGAASLAEPHWGAANTAVTIPPYQWVTQTLPNVRCGDVLGLNKEYDHNPPGQTNYASLGASRLWTINFGLPNGVSAVQDFLFVDVLPMHGTDTYISINPSDFVAALTPYFCTLTPGAYLDPANVPGYITSGQCKPAITGLPGPYFYYWHAAPSQSIDAVSHFIYWGSYEATNDQGMISNYFYEYTIVPENLDVASLGDGMLHNYAYVTGLADLDFNSATPPTRFGNFVPEVGTEDPYEDKGSARVVDYACPTGYFHDSYSGPRTLSPGDCSWATFLLYSVQPFKPSKNLGLQVEVPDGVEVVDTDFYYDIYSPCIENPDVGVTEPAPPFSDPLLWQLGGDDGDCSQPYDTTLVRVLFCADPNTAFTNGQGLTFTLDLLANDNDPQPPDVCPAYTRHSTTTFTMLVPAEMSETVAPLCREDGGISFKAGARNTGGIDLVDVVPMFTLPRAATGSGADTVYQGVTNVVTSGQPYVVEGSVDGLAWTADPTPGDTSIRYVRLRGTGPDGLQIAAVTGSPITYDILVSSSGTSGVELFGGGTLDGATATGPLATANAAANQPYVIDGCKPLTITKFFDANGDGDDDGAANGEPKLAGWSFSITNEDGAEVATVTTDVTGQTTLLLSVGDYTITELAPATAPSTWSVTTPTDAVADDAAEVTLTLAMSSLSVTFGNVCACPDGDDDRCTGRCLADGSCDDTFVVSCDDLSSCSADSCNPDTGLCEHIQKDCTAVDYYLPVEDAQGNAVGTIHCVFEPGEDPICDQENGKLKVWPLGTPEMQRCENR